MSITYRSSAPVIIGEESASSSPPSPSSSSAQSASATTSAPPGPTSLGFTATYEAVCGGDLDLVSEMIGGGGGAE